MSEEGLLTAATDVLRSSGFSVTAEHLDDTDDGWVLAENDLFIVAVVAALDLDELRRLESFAAPQLLARLNAVDDVGGKRWDAYLVLLGRQAGLPADEARELVAIGYDTRGVRRLIAVGVEPTEASVREILRPFLPLPRPTPGGLADALQDLEEQLTLNGVDADEARRLIAAFEDKGHLNDV